MIGTDARSGANQLSGDGVCREIAWHHFDKVDYRKRKPFGSIAEFVEILCHAAAMSTRHAMNVCP